MMQEFLLGDIIKGYRIVREIGRGSMGIVYEAIQINLERPVALKILYLNDQNQDNSEFISRFFSEVRVVAKLIHPNIIQAYDAGSDQARYFYAMEYVDGKNVKDIIKQEKCLLIERVITIGKELTDALDYGWKQYRMIHGDIKPENIMIDVRQRTKLMDFGLATMKNNTKQAADTNSRSLIFTPLYAAPELIQAEQGNAATILTDIYALGASLYQMLCGEPPFPGTDPSVVMKRHLEEQPIPLYCRVENIPRSLSDLIDSMLNKNSMERIDDWEKINKQLDVCLQDYHREEEERRQQIIAEREAALAPSPSNKIVVPHKEDVKIIIPQSHGKVTFGKKKQGIKGSQKKRPFIRRRVTESSAGIRLFVFFFLISLVVIFVFILANVNKFSSFVVESPNEGYPAPQLHWDE